MHLRVTFKRTILCDKTMLLIEGAEVDSGSLFSETLIFKTTAQLVRSLAETDLPISIALDSGYGPAVVSADTLIALGVRQIT